MTSLERVLPFAAAAVLCACSPDIHMSDSIDTQWDRQDSRSYDNVVHTPYVAGASVTLYAYDFTEGYDLDGWTITSSDPAVIDVIAVDVLRDRLDGESSSRTDIITARVSAVGPGVAMAEVRKPSGTIAHEVELRVLEAERAILRPAGPLFIEQELLAQDLVGTTPKLLNAGLATFLVEWWAGDEQLFGTGALALTTEHPDILVLDSKIEHQDEAREWAQLQLFTEDETPQTATVELLANGEPTTSVAFELVDEAAIDSIELLAQDLPADAAVGDPLAVLAAALDVSGESIWGVDFDWDIDGDNELGEGDIFRYYYDPDASSILAAEHGELRAELPISGEDGFVDSSNDDALTSSCFCSAAAGERPRGGIALGLLTLLTFAGLRRRRIWAERLRAGC